MWHCNGYSCGTCFMAEIDELIHKCAHTNEILFLLRFLDDILIWWTAGIEALERFMADLNKLHNTIKFTLSCDYENKSCNFLDLTITNKNGKIETDLYRKPTDTVKYLLPSSSHPKHVCRSIPYSLALRIRRICSEETTFIQRIEELKLMLLSRKYKREEVDKQIIKVKELTRTEALEVTQRRESTRTTFSITYKPQLPSVANIIQKHWRSMTFENDSTKEIFPEPPMVSYRQPKNLKGLLCRAKVPKKQERQTRGNTHSSKGLKKCLKSKCCMCPFINSSPNIESTNSDVKLQTSKSFNCFSKSVIYILTCQKCSHQYIGQTGRQVKERIAEHIQNIKSGTNTPVGQHFKRPGHALRDLSVQIIEEEKTQSRTKREIRESNWIRRFKAEINEKI